MAKGSKTFKAWRKQQKRGAIMKPKTFGKIARSASARGYRNPQAVAGAAYWKTARAKFRARRGK